jgi:Domain of unknown function (DUF222)/HNH endonuclease
MASPQARLGRDLSDSIDCLHADISAHHRDLLRLVARGDERGLWRDDGCRDMAQWLAGRLGISTWSARRWVDAAHALECLPRLSHALGTGTLSLDKTLELARFATPETEQKLITWARRVSPAAIRRRADRAQRQALEEVRDTERSRFLRWWWFDDGRRLGLEGEFPAADGVAITTALRRVAERVPDVPADDVDDRPEDRVERRLADALHALAMTAVASDADADRSTVVVHTVLEDPDSAGDIEFGPVVHPEVRRRLSCDARLQFVLTDRRGNALGIGRTSRNVPEWLMRPLLFRDHGCTFPGCGTRAFLKAHHIRHWEHGGPTDLDNLVLTCHFHHKLVHEFGWGVALDGDHAQWFRPTGKRYDPGPDPPGQLSIHTQRARVAATPSLQLVPVHSQ